MGLECCLNFYLFSVSLVWKEAGNYNLQCTLDKRKKFVPSSWCPVAFNQNDDQTECLPVGHRGKISLPCVGNLISAVVELIRYQKSFSGLWEIIAIEELYWLFVCKFCCESFLHTLCRIPSSLSFYWEMITAFVVLAGSWLLDSLMWNKGIMWIMLFHWIIASCYLLLKVNMGCKGVGFYLAINRYELVTEFTLAEKSVKQTDLSLGVLFPV